MARISLCLVALAALASATVAEHVITLSGMEEFSAAVKKHDKLVVEFYAPWCGHCKKLTPEYEKAAEALKEDGIVLAKVDATEEANKPVASKFGVQGFPTLKVFRGSEKGDEWQGPREADGIVSYAKKIFGPATSELTTADEVKKAEKSELTVLGIFPKGASSKEFKVFSDVASSLRDDATFAHTFSPKLTTDCSDCKAAAVIVYKDFDEPITKFTETITAPALTKFIEAATTPELLPLNRDPRYKKAISKVFADKLPKLLGVSPKDFKDLETFKKNLIAIGKSTEGVHVLFTDPDENEGALKYFGLEKADTPALLVHEPESNAKYINKNIDVRAMSKWVEQYKAGKLAKAIKSEEIPETNDEPVTVLVAKQFEEIVFGGKDVLVEFYAPWCGHCKTLAPIYEELAAKFKDNDSLIIAKMDATANDVPGDKFNVKGFPTLYMVTGADQKVIAYEGDRSLADLEKFVKKHAKIESSAADEEEEDDGEDDDEDDDEDKDEL